MNKYEQRLKDNGIDTKYYDYLFKYMDKSKDMDLAIEELISGKPVQYVVGNVYFYNSKVNVNENVLIPRFETELLVEKTIKYCKDYFNDNIKILDMCTGSGCIAISMKKELDSCIDAVDIFSEALEVAKENALLNKTDINFIESDLFDKVNNKYDVIISNPPYISYNEEIMDIVKNNEPSIALYASCDGLYFYDKILKECNKYLNDRYIIAFEIGYTQANSIKEMIYKYLGDVSISIEKDYSGKDRYIFIKNS